MLQTISIGRKGTVREPYLTVRDDRSYLYCTFSTSRWGIPFINKSRHPAAYGQFYQAGSASPDLLRTQGDIKALPMLQFQSFEESYPQAHSSLIGSFNNYIFTSGILEEVEEVEFAKWVDV